MNETFVQPLIAAPPAPASVRSVPWSMRELVVGTVAVLVALFLFVLALVTPAQAIFGAESTETYFVGFVASVAWHGAIVLIIYRIVRRTSGSWRDLGFRLPEPAYGAWGRLFGQAIVLSIAARVIVIAYVLMADILGLDFLTPSDQLPEDVVSRNVLLPIIGFSLAFSAPLAEELLFRGFLFAGLRRYLPFLPSALISGSLFSAAHFQLGLFIPFLLIGALFAYSYERTNSLYQTILTHFLFNLLSFALIVVLV